MKLPEVYMLPLSNLRKIDTDPPQYTLTIYNRDITLTSKQFQEYPRFRCRVEEVLDIVLPSRLDKQKWDSIRAELHASARKGKKTNQ